MSTLLVVVVVAAILWLFGFWPFNRSYAYVPRFDDLRQKKDSAPPVDDKPPL
jgi:hypothetical protein